MAIKELPVRKTIPGSEPDPLGLSISNEDRANWNNGKDRAVGDKTLSEMDSALASRTRPVKPGTEMLNRAQPKGLLGAGMLYSKDNNIPKPSEERPLDASSLEQITESNPEAIQEALPNTPIAEEARQITDDSDARNNEVNNQAAEETVSRISDEFETVDDLYNYLENYGMGFNNGRVDDVDLNGPDFPVDNNMARDEDFTGPDEQLDQALDESMTVFDPGLEDQNQYADSVTPEEIDNADATVYNESQASQPVMTEEKFEPAPEAPYADNVVQVKQEQDLDQAVDEAMGETTNEQPSEPSESSISIPKETLPTANYGSGAAGGSSISSSPVRIPGSSFGSAFHGGSPFRPGAIPSGSVSAASPSAHTIPNQTKGNTAHSSAGGGTKPVEAAKQGTSSNPICGSKSSGNVISNGANYSGGTNKTSRSLKYVPSSKVLPHGEDRMESYDVEAISNGASSGNEATSSIKARIASIEPKSLAEQLGFVKDTFNGTPIDDLTPEQIREVEKILDTLGV